MNIADQLNNAYLNAWNSWQCGAFNSIKSSRWIASKEILKLFKGSVLRNNFGWGSIIRVEIQNNTNTTIIKNNV